MHFQVGKVCMAAARCGGCQFHVALYQRAALHALELEVRSGELVGDLAS